MHATKTNANSELLFLTDERLRAQIELLFFGYKAITEDADRILDGYGYGRAHHRALYFINRHPQLKVNDLLSILGISKQSLNRVLRPLIADGFVTSTIGQMDRRERNLALTEKGRALEGELAAAQMKRLRGAFTRAGPEAVHGFSTVLREMLDSEALRILGALGQNSGRDL